MAAELGQTNDPKQLVPGDVAAVTDTMWAIRSYGDTLHEAGTGLSKIDTEQGWRGQAADQFRSRFKGEPGKWMEAGDSFHNAADAIDSYATTLNWAQQQAGEAIRLWNEGEADTAQAKTEHANAVEQARQEAQRQSANGIPTSPPNIPFVDPGEAKRQAARHTLDNACSQLRSSGDTAERTVDVARDKAPKKPGFWSKVGDVLSDIGDGIVDVGAHAVNDLASFGNAVLNHPGDVLTAAAGVGLTVISAGGEGLGVALDATGIGAIPGGALNVISAAGMATGATMAMGAVGDLGRHAATDDRVSPVETSGGRSSGPGGKAGRKTDRLKEHLTDEDLDGARRELKGEVVKRKSSGQPWDHVHEVRDAQNGLVNRITQLQRQIGDTRISDTDRAALQSELSEASRLLDYSEQFVPRH
jgi:hypothetical protein